MPTTSKKEPSKRFERALEAVQLRTMTLYSWRDWSRPRMTLDCERGNEESSE